MRKKQLLVLPFLMIFAMGCGLISGVQGLQNAATTALPAVETAASTDLPAVETAASTDMPALLTAVPTGQGMIETMAAGQTGSSNCPSTPTAGGLGISIGTAKTLLQMSQQFAIADGSVGGQPAAIITLTPSGASSFPAIAQGFTAQYIGDPCNLSRISITIPRTGQQDTADQGVSVLNIVLTGTLPVDVQLAFFTWVTQNYPTVPVSGQQQTTIKTFQFNLQRNQTSMVLDIVPTK
ncbi:MAG: hypothetical protein ABSA01_05030 [Anaerolineales bacterium]|jgi:hypothetical protein